jgi:hypothetical protein
MNVIAEMVTLKGQSHKIKKFSLYTTSALKGAAAAKIIFA